MQRGRFCSYLFLLTSPASLPHFNRILMFFFSKFQMHDRVEELICEQSLADMVFFTENDGKLRLDSAAL